MKKAITLALLATLVCTATAPALAADHAEKTVIRSQNPNAFGDVDGHFAKDAIVRLLDMGVLTTKDGKEKFEPLAKLDRKELKVWVKTMFGKDVLDGADSQFVTRAEVAAVIAEAMPAVNTGIAGHLVKAPFSDIAHVAADQRSALDSVYALGLMVGDGTGRFLPEQALTKGEAAVLMQRVFERSMQAAKKAEFEEVQDLDNLPEDVYTFLQENHEMQGVEVVHVNGDSYILVFGGMQPSGGYSIHVNHVNESDAGYFVSAELAAPQDVAAAVVTFPTKVLKVKGHKKPAYLF